MGQRYKLLGFNSPENSANILISRTGRIMRISIKELERSEFIDDFNAHELKSIYRKIYSSDNDAASVYDIEDRNQKSWVFYSNLVLLLSVFYVFSNFAAAKPVYLQQLDIIVTPGTFIYPLSFLVIDLLSEFYGFKLAKRAIYMSLFANLIIVILLSVSTQLPAIPDWSLNEFYNLLISQVVSAVIASSLAFFLSEYVNSYILCTLKKLTSSRFLFVRVFFSTLAAAIIDSFVFCFIAFYGKMEFDSIVKMAVLQIIIKFFFAIFNVFPAYWCRYLFNRFIYNHEK